MPARHHNATWAPRHQGLKLAHHLVPAFVLAAFLTGLAVASAMLGSWFFAAGMLALAVGTVGAIVGEFRHGGAVPPETSAVETSTGVRAATRFALASPSVVFSAVTVGTGVVTMVAALALSARYLLLQTDGLRWLTFAASAVLLGVGVLVVRSGLRLMRIAASRQPPGMYLTRSRVVLYGPQGERELYWRDVGSVSAENPPGRAPLGRRGPARIVLRPVADAADPRGARQLRVHVQYLAADPNLLYRALRHYAANPADRPELGTDEALRRLAEPEG
jgi:hypothetical protein